MAFLPGRSGASASPSSPILRRGWAPFLVLLSVGCSPGGEPGEEARADGGDRPAPAIPGHGEGDFPLTLRDATGAAKTFPAPPERIVTLVPSASQIFLVLEAGHRLVGRTDHDTASVLAHLPSVGGGLHPNLEALLALEPDLVIRFAGRSDPDTPRRLEEFGIPHFAIRPERMEDILSAIRELGLIVGRASLADSVLAEMEATLQEIREGIRGRPRVRTAYVLGGDPPWVAGPLSYLHEILTLAGGENAFSDLDAAYGPVSQEAFLVRGIELILTPEGGDPALPEMEVPIRRVPPSLEIPGPYLARDALRLARILHPEAFR